MEGAVIRMSGNNMKDVIADSLITLSEQKSLDKITIKDLVSACNSSRQCFYYHYQDILEVVEWILQRKNKELLSQSLKAKTSKDALDIFIDFLSTNNAFIQHLLNSKHREFIERMLVDSLRSYLQEMLICKDPNIMTSYADFSVMINFCTYGLAGLMLENTNGKKIDTDKLIDQIERLIPNEDIHNVS